MGASNQICVLALLVSSATTHAAERYREAVVDNTGMLKIITEDGRRLMAEPEPDMDSGPAAGLYQIRIAPNRRAVGWLVKYANCCTSYPIPMALVGPVRGWRSHSRRAVESRAGAGPAGGVSRGGQPSPNRVDAVAHVGRRQSSAASTCVGVSLRWIRAPRSYFHASFAIAGLNTTPPIDHAGGPWFTARHCHSPG